MSECDWKASGSLMVVVVFMSRLGLTRRKVSERADTARNYTVATNYFKASHKTVLGSLHCLARWHCVTRYDVAPRNEAPPSRSCRL